MGSRKTKYMKGSRTIVYEKNICMKKIQRVEENKKQQQKFSTHSEWLPPSTKTPPFGSFSGLSPLSILKATVSNFIALPMFLSSEKTMKIKSCLYFECLKFDCSRINTKCKICKMRKIKNITV